MKLLYLPIIFLLFLSMAMQSQNQKTIDSLKLLLKKHQAEDSIRVDILTHLHENIMFSQPEEAKKYALEELRISEKINMSSGIAKGNMHLADYYMNKNVSDSAVFYYNRAKEIFIKINHSRGVVFVNYSLAGIMQSQGNYDESIALLNENLHLIDKNETNEIGKIKFSAGSFHSLAAIYMAKGDYKLALIDATKALDMFNEVNDVTRAADTNKLLGDLESLQGNYNESYNYYLNAIKVYKEQNDIFYLALAYNAIGKVLIELNQLDEAESYQKQSVDLSRKNQDNATLAAALRDYGDILISKNQLDQASVVLNESKSIAEKEDIKLSIINAQKSLAKISLKRNQYTIAINQLTNGLEIAEEIGAMPHVQELLEMQSEVYQKLNLNKEGLISLQQLKKINDSLFNIKKSQQFEELSIIYETERREAAIALQEEEIKTLNTQTENDKLTKTLYGGGAVAGIALSGLLFFGFRQRMKKNKMAREKQEEIYKQEIAFKQKELASQTLHLVQKNTFLHELKENLEKLKNSPDKFKMEFRRIVMLLKKESATDKDWEVFKSYFSEVHDNFDNKLKAINDTITEKDLRLASFIKMNLSTKEIAALLNVLPESVLTSKYRLKKKLGIDKETDIYNFLMKI